MSFFILSAICLITVYSKEWELPYNTEIEEYKFLYEEPSITLDDVIAKEPTDTYDIIYDMMGRVLGGKDLLSQFQLELIIADGNNQDDIPIYRPKSRDDHPFWSKPTSLYLDVIELDNDGKNIILRGSSTVALAVAFNWYLEEIANTTYDWHTYSIDMPTSPLPLPPSMQKRRSVPYMYYQNVCTVSYTFAFWDWEIWQQHLDWMAMQGINMPLAFTGQEYVWAKTFATFGYNSSDMQTFFAGPAFYAWQRMGNMQGWGGPLRESEIMGQYNLQLQILARMNTFEMTPALTCFSGHVPEATTRLYPQADVVKSPDWGGFNATYCCVLLLNFTDPLFQQIGTEFINQQTKYYGTGHVYQCDTFNEMNPPTTNPTYLKSATEYVYAAMNTADEDAIWLMQGWLFHSGFWNTKTVAAYLSGVADDAMIILDLNTEVSPIYNKYDSYYGKPFIFNTLHDYGGHDGIQGNLPKIVTNYVDALNFKDTTVMGVGTTMEGIWQNYIVYDTTYKMGYETKAINVSEFGIKYAYRRYGLTHTNNNNIGVTNALVNAWSTLVSTLYADGDTPQDSYVTEFPNFGYSKLSHDPKVVQAVWKEFVGTGSTLTNIVKFRYDLVDVTRQAMSDLFNLAYQNFSAAYNGKDVTSAQSYANTMIAAIADMDTILLTDKYWMLGTWIGMARNQANGTNDNNDTANWYEFNARNQITLWGPTGQINNYACKQWGDVVGTYYQPQWQLFVDQAIECMKNGSKWNENAFFESNYPKYELPFTYTIGGYHTATVGDTVTVACNLYKKWNMNGDSTCT